MSLSCDSADMTYHFAPVIDHQLLRGYGDGARCTVTVRSMLQLLIDQCSNAGGRRQVTNEWNVLPLPFGGKEA